MDVKKIGLQQKGKNTDCIQKLKEKALESNEHVQILFGICSEQDIEIAEIILQRKNKNFPVLIEFILPYETVADHWNEETRDRFFRVMEHCDRETMLQTRYTADCLEKMELYIRQQSDAIL